MMITQDVTLSLPENLYIRLTQAAQATHQSMNDVLLRAVKIGSPPNWEDAPVEFQADLAALGHLDDEALWQIAKQKKTEDDMVAFQILLDKQANEEISAEEYLQLRAMRLEADRFMLCKAHAVALLRWRGHIIPPPEML
jgi:hypothetical protein